MNSTKRLKPGDKLIVFTDHDVMIIDCNDTQATPEGGYQALHVRHLDWHDIITHTTPNKPYQ